MIISTAITAGAAAVYLSENTKATPQEVADALFKEGEGMIQGVPANTTDAGLWMGGKKDKKDKKENKEKKK